MMEEEFGKNGKTGDTCGYTAACPQCLDEAAKASGRSSFARRRWAAANRARSRCLISGWCPREQDLTSQPRHPCQPLLSAVHPRTQPADNQPMEEIFKVHSRQARQVVPRTS
jgi:hypothetical protein